MTLFSAGLDSIGLDSAGFGSAGLKFVCVLSGTFIGFIIEGVCGYGCCCFGVGLGF